MLVGKSLLFFLLAVLSLPNDKTPLSRPVVLCTQQTPAESLQLSYLLPSFPASSQLSSPSQGLKNCDFPFNNHPLYHHYEDAQPTQTKGKAETRPTILSQDVLGPM